MSISLRFITEWFRALCILMLGGILLFEVESLIYPKVALEHTWFMGAANLIIIFVLYRNKLQFTGWYKSERSVRLSKPLTFMLLIIAVSLLIMQLIF